MVISFPNTVPEADREFMKSLISAINTNSAVLANDPVRTIRVVKGWHQNAYVDTFWHFNIVYPDDHLMSGREIHIHMLPIYDEWGNLYHDPAPT